jgi:ADP-ribose pyrophosphatase YjhB (NUDIX family)
MIKVKHEQLYRHRNDIRDDKDRLIIPFDTSRFGWALPGGGVSYLRREAERFARILQELCKGIM